MSRREPLDTTVNAERLLALRSFAGFEDLDVADAALLLGAMRERALPGGTRLARRGASAPAAWFVVEGELAVNDTGGPRLVRSGETVGMLELLADAADGLDVESSGEAIVLELEKADLTAMLAANFDMLADAMRSLSRVILMFSPLEVGPMSTHAPQRAALGFVDTLLLLHELSPFGAIGAETMTELASSLRELAVAGTVEPRGGVSRRVYLVMEGALRYGALEIPAGNGFGALQAIGEAPLVHDVVARDGTRVLVWALDAIMDALDDDIPFALEWLRRLATRAYELAAAAVPRMPLQID